MNEAIIRKFFSELEVETSMMSIKV